jgi:hypothetical protein
MTKEKFFVDRHFCVAILFSWKHELIWSECISDGALAKQEKLGLDFLGEFYP